MSEALAKELKSRLAAMNTVKEKWKHIYDTITEYVMDVRDLILTEGLEGEVKTTEQFDATAGRSNELMAASLIGALWPNTAESFTITPPESMKDLGEEDDEVKKYYSFVNRQMSRYMDAPRAGLMTTLQTYMEDQGAYGTSGIEVHERDDEDRPLYFKPVSILNSYISEGPDKFVDTVFTEELMSYRQVIAEYGESALHPTRKEAMSKENFDPDKEKFKVVRCVYPRTKAQMKKARGNKAYPIASVHMDCEKSHIMRESGFIEMPVFMSRFRKGTREIMGRCPSMRALPDIMEVNVTRELGIMAQEQLVDPSLMVMDDGSGGNEIIDTSPGGITVINSSGKLGQSSRPPIERLFTVGDPSWADARIQQLQEVITQHYYIDRLLDLNNEARMTLGEAQIRNKLRGESLGAIYPRQIAEVFEPMIERCFNSLRRRGFLGVVPNSLEHQKAQAEGREVVLIPEKVVKLMTNGDNVYDIKFISPAARIMHNQELEGIIQTIEAATAIAQTSPTVLDNFDPDDAFRRVVYLTGAPESIARPTGQLPKLTVKELREQRASQEAKVAEQEAQRQQSETGRNLAQAIGTIANAEQNGR